MSAKLIHGYEVVIGFETHTQLATHSKIFSRASTAFGAEPNTQACAVDLALPGTLPVMNREAVAYAIKLGLALGSHIAPRSIFARKNYFYPDLPKGYQISQFEIPVVQGGEVSFYLGDEPKTVRLVRAHLEEDAGKSLHDDFEGFNGEKSSGIDLNRAGTPLLEIVTEPDIRSSKEAAEYARALHTLVVWLGICDGNMQEGSFRCDVNVSVRRPGAPLGTRREIKNLNSFKHIVQAADYEINWQIDELEDGRAIEQATILFNPDTGETRAMRTKEDAHDYRYFPDPDLPPLVIAPEWIAEVRASLPELPAAMAQRFQDVDGLPAYDAAMMTQSLPLARFYEACSPEDLRLRFFFTRREVPHSELARYCQIDYEREMAFLATVTHADGSEETIGSVRGISDPNNDEAEFAVIVRSDMKGRRLGWVLMDKLIRYLRATLGGCRFYNCTHRHEPGCSVRAHVGTDPAQDPLAISDNRYRLYNELYDELSNKRLY